MTIRTRSAFKAGIAFIGVTLGILLVAVTINTSFGLPFNIELWPPGQDYTLRAAFKDANGLIRGADVVVSGHTVGQVTNVAVSGDESIVTMRIKPQFSPLHSGTVARIRFGTLLAQKYVEVAPVGGSKVLPSGATIPSDQTITPVDFDKFLSALDPETRQKLQVVIQQGGDSVSGRASAINDLLDQLHALSLESRPGLNALAAHQEDIGSITANLAVVSNRLAQSHDNLGLLVQNANDVNATLANQNDSLTRLIVHLGNVMDTFNLTLDGNEQNLHQTVVLLDPLVGALNVAFGTTEGYLGPSLPDIVRGINTLGPEGEGAIHQRDANGNYLRQYLVADAACDQLNANYNPACGTGGSAAKATPGASSPAPSSTPPAALPTPPGVLPTPNPNPTATPCDPLDVLLNRCKP